MGLLNWFKSSNQDESSFQRQQPTTTWDPNTLTMQQPAIPAAPTTDPVVSQQPNPQESMQMNLRGGAGCWDVCCGVCSGLLCFECCEDCC